MMLENDDAGRQHTMGNSCTARGPPMGGVGHAGVGWVMQGRGGSCRGGVSHAGVGWGGSCRGRWVKQRWAVVDHGGVG